MGINRQEEKYQYLLGIMTQLMSAGAHSFHEIMSAAISTKRR